MLPGCGSGPSKANIQLRIDNQKLSDEIAVLQRQRDADRATIASLQNSATTVPSLPQQRIDKLFTAAGLRLGALTAGYDIDSSKPGDEAIRVQAVPVDQDGQPLKAAGSFVIDAFDLSTGGLRLGQWTFDVDQSRAAWHGEGLLYDYILICPLTAPPEHANITLKVQFTDELTRRQFEVQKVVTVHPR